MYNEDDIIEQQEEINFPWLVFRLKENLYTVNSKIITSIVIIPEDITIVPNVPNYIKGLIHLRGSVIPLIDLRLLFKIKSVKEEYEEFKITKSNEEFKSFKEMVVILEKNNSYVGITVDEVLSVESIIPFEETDEIRKMCKDKYVSGVAKSEKTNDILLILDEEKIMNMTEFQDIRE